MYIMNGSAWWFIEHLLLDVFHKAYFDKIFQKSNIEFLGIPLLHMVDKGVALKPNKPLLLTALTTQGNRVFDRALKNIGGKGWPGAADLEEINKKVGAEFQQENMASQQGDTWN